MKFLGRVNDDSKRGTISSTSTRDGGSLYYETTSVRYMGRVKTDVKRVMRFRLRYGSKSPFDKEPESLFIVWTRTRLRHSVEDPFV